MRIIGLPSGTVQSTDDIAIDNSTNGTRRVGLSTYVDGEVTAVATPIATSEASSAVSSDRPIYRSDSITSLPKTISVTGCTANHRVVAPLITGATTSFVLAWSTASGSVTFSLSSGTFSSCTVDYILEITQ